MVGHEAMENLMLWLHFDVTRFSLIIVVSLVLLDLTVHQHDVLGNVLLGKLCRVFRGRILINFTLVCWLADVLQLSIQVHLDQASL